MVSFRANAIGGSGGSGGAGGAGGVGGAEEKEKDINKLELTEKLEEMQLPVQPEWWTSNHPNAGYGGDGGMVSEVLAELVVTVVHGVLLEAQVRQVTLVVLEQQELLAVLDLIWEIKLVPTHKIPELLVTAEVAETQVVAEALVAQQAHT